MPAILIRDFWNDFWRKADKSMGGLDFPRLYAILDRACFAGESDATAAMAQFARALMAGGTTLIQYRNKTGNVREMLSQARELRRVGLDGTAGASVRLIMNDRADLCLAADFDGVHVGQEDLSSAAARRILGDSRWLGVSTHNPEQVSEAEQWPVDYIAVGPVFATASKANLDPVIGLEGVRTARRLTRKPLIAIGGITRGNCRSVIDAGADSVAVIADLLRDPKASAEEFLRILS
jgi:thiamine-phosphate pyrophosphorylase